MAQPELEQRAPLPGEDVLSTAQVVAMTGMSRQGVDAAVRAGRMAGFREPGPPPRIWVHRAAAEARTPVGAELARRVQELADVVAVLRSEVTDMKSERVEVDRIREENATLRAVNLELLAAAASQRDVEGLLHEAAELDRAARGKAGEALKKARTVQERYADALSQTQLPGSLD